MLNKTIGTVLNFTELVAAYVKLNLKAQMEYRTAFISQVAAMFLNDCVWVLFWSVFFTRFPVVKGYGAADVITLWAISAAGFGIAHTVCGNALSLAGLIARGQLDAWMLYPRALLPHIVIGKMSAASLGDALFGYAVYIFFVRPDLAHFALFTVLTISVAFLFTGFSVITGSLSFFLGNSESLSEQWRFAMITFSTYPASLFDGAVKLLLYTIIPAAFVSYLPIEALRKFSMMEALFSFAGAAGVVAFAVAIFYLGLRRYESGNLAEMRG